MCKLCDDEARTTVDILGTEQSTGFVAPILREVLNSGGTQSQRLQAMRRDRLVVQRQIQQLISQFELRHELTVEEVVLGQGMRPIVKMGDNRTRYVDHTNYVVLGVELW